MLTYLWNYCEKLLVGFMRFDPSFRGKPAGMLSFAIKKPIIGGSLSRYVHPATGARFVLPSGFTIHINATGCGAMFSRASMKLIVWINSLPYFILARKIIQNPDKYSTNFSIIWNGHEASFCLASWLLFSLLCCGKQGSIRYAETVVNKFFTITFS